MDRAGLAICLGVRLSTQTPRDTVVCEEDPHRFQSAFANGVAAGGLVYLADPKWTMAERSAFVQVCAETSGFGREAGQRGNRGWLCIPTGGTGGKLKLARHDETTLVAAVRGFQQYFAEGAVNAFGVLPLHHVSGLMAWLRCALTGGIYTAGSWPALQSGVLPKEREVGGYVSLVPTQMQKLLANASGVRWLKSFRAVFVGGGPSWSALLEEAAGQDIPVVLSYGMTETAAMVAAQRPGEFLAGDRSCGRALPHAEIRTDDAGIVSISGGSVFRGYAGGASMPTDQFVTQDFGRIDELGRLWIDGRRDQVIITGGEKVDPFAVESVLRATRQFSDLAVLGLSDPLWGHIVAACYEDTGNPPDWQCVQREVERMLAPYRRPKRYVPIKDWPRNAQGKVNRAILHQALLAALPR